MAKLSVKAGATSQSFNIFIQDSSSTTGAGLTGLVFNTSSLVAYYALTRAAAVQITLATLAAITTAWSSGGFKEVDPTNMPGWYRLDLPDAALASGRFVAVHLKGASNMAPLALEIELTGWDNQSTTDGGLSKLTSLTFTVAAQIDANVIDWKGATAPAMTGDAFARLGAPAGASVSADIAAVKTDTAAIKTKTDSLTFTVATMVDANVIDWKSATAPAMTGDAFARLGAPAGASVSADVAAAYARLGAPAGASMSADIAGVQADTDDVQSRLPAALVAGRMAAIILSNIKKNQALLTFAFLMTDSTTHAPATGLTVTCTRSIDGAAFGAGTLANVIEIGSGVYAVDFGAGDLNGNVIVLKATATGADATMERIVTQP